jgi:hypothetical protein
MAVRSGHFETKGYKKTKGGEMELRRCTVGYSLLDRRKNEDFLEKKT